MTTCAKCGDTDGSPEMWACAGAVFVCIDSAACARRADLRDATASAAWEKEQATPTMTAGEERDRSAARVAAHPAEPGWSAAARAHAVIDALRIELLDLRNANHFLGVEIYKNALDQMKETLVRRAKEYDDLRAAVLEVEDGMSGNALLTLAAPSLVTHFCAELRKACGEP